MSTTATGPPEAAAELLGGDGRVVQVAGAAEGTPQCVVAGRPAAGVGERLAARDEVDRAQGDVDGGAGRLPCPRPDEGHRVVGEVARARPDGARHGRRARQLPVGEHVGDDSVAREIGGGPLGPDVAQEGDERRVVDGEEQLVRVRLGVDLPGAGGSERRADRLGAGGQLGAGRAHADPHLTGGLVAEAVVAPRERQAQRHPGDATTLAGMARIRDDGIAPGRLEPGPRNSIADAGGVRVGHVTIRRDDPVARTGVTAVVPPTLPLSAGTAVLNGAGELTGSLEIREWGRIDTPVYLTSTHAVGRIYDGAVAVAIAADPNVGIDDVVIPIVGECDDSHLSDARHVHVEAADAGRAVAAASLDVEEGAVGAGTGMVCFGWKGGIGTASRVAGDHVVGALVLANFGTPEQLRVAGVRLGDLGGAAPATPAGSCIAVLATDAPLGPHQLERLARRAGLGLARVGSVAHHGSGEIFLAFATATGRSHPDSELDGLFEAAVEATEEAVLNALWAAVDTDGRNGRVVRALPHAEVIWAFHSRVIPPPS